MIRFLPPGLPFLTACGHGFLSGWAAEPRLNWGRATAPAKSQWRGRGAGFDGRVPVLNRLGRLREPVVGLGTAPMAISQEQLGGHVARLLLVHGSEGSDGQVEPF